jgi:hypothetical protein
MITNAQGGPPTTCTSSTDNKCHALPAGPHRNDQDRPAKSQPASFTEEMVMGHSPSSRHRSGRSLRSAGVAGGRATPPPIPIDACVTRD